MMKNTTKHIFFFIIFCALSCSKESTSEVNAQYPMKALIENGVLDLQSTVNSASNFEIGYKFKAFKNGKIKAVNIRIPENGSYRVSLWNFDTQELLLTEEVTSSSGLISSKSISPISILASTNYFISVNTNSYYIFNKEGAVIFPIDIEDILVKEYGSNLGTSQTLPSNFNTTSYLGMVDIEFVPNN